MHSEPHTQLRIASLQEASEVECSDAIRKYYRCLVVCSFFIFAYMWHGKYTEYTFIVLESVSRNPEEGVFDLRPLSR